MGTVTVAGCASDGGDDSDPDSDGDEDSDPGSDGANGNGDSDVEDADADWVEGGTFVGVETTDAEFLQGATVELYRTRDEYNGGEPPVHRETTDEWGEVWFDVDDGTTYYLVVTHDEYRTETREIEGGRSYGIGVEPGDDWNVVEVTVTVEYQDEPLEGDDLEMLLLDAWGDVYDVARTDTGVVSFPAVAGYSFYELHIRDREADVYFRPPPVEVPGPGSSETEEPSEIHETVTVDSPWMTTKEGTGFERPYYDHGLRNEFESLAAYTDGVAESDADEPADWVWANDP
ncbi:hypothetical protein OB905_07930 [Halobacteria archaeon AArc-dxtr1]|nr:hypothetical protein [Halobacteria archaeon AArc-dxtr1]